LWLLEELKVDYELKTYKRQNMFAPPELKEVHPLGKSPLVSVETEATSKPLVLAESGLITEYLAENFGPWLVPKKYQEGKDGQTGGETEGWLRYRYYMHYAEGSLMPMLLIALLMNSKPGHMCF
jgi:glutathione S-transferase